MKTKLDKNVNRMSERQKDITTDRLTDRQTDRQIERQNFFSLVIKTKIRMSTGCQKVSQTDRKIYCAPGRRTE